MKISRILTIANKEIILRLRFKWDYILSSLIYPLRLGLLFFFIYTGFFHSGAESIQYINKENYIVFLALGMVFANFLTLGLETFKQRFLWEKYWQTIQGLLTSPAKKIEIILGFGISGVINILPILILSLTIAYITQPIHIVKLLFIIASIGLMYIMVLGIGFINAAFILSNENISGLFNYVSWGLLLLSCFYYPITSLPEIIHPIIKLNPFYYANLVIKGLWMYNNLNVPSFFYLLFLALLSLAIGIFIFNWVWKKKGIEGY